MRYLYYLGINRKKSTVVIIDGSESVKFFPEGAGAGLATYYPWIEIHKNDKQLGIKDRRIFEICENQFKKFKEHGIIPIRVDW